MWGADEGLWSGDASGGHVTEGVVLGVGVPALPQDPDPAAGQDADCVRVSVASGAGVGVDLRAQGSP